MEIPQRKRLRMNASVYREPGRVFSITIGTSPRRDVFRDVAFGLGSIQLLRDLSHEKGNRVFAHCLMPDHVHALVESLADSPLDSFVGAWKSQCYREWKRRGKRQSFWQRSFYDHALRNDEDLRAAALYILFNPVRKGLVAEFHEYPLCGSFVFDL